MIRTTTRFSFLLLIAALLLVNTYSLADSYSWKDANQMEGRKLSSGVTLETGTNEFDIFVINLLAGIYPSAQATPTIGMGYVAAGSGFRPDLTGMLAQPVTFHLYAAGMNAAEILNSLTSGANFISAVRASVARID